MQPKLAVFMGLALVCSARAQSTADLLSLDLNNAEWLVSNQNGSLSFETGRLPLMVLEGLVAANEVKSGDPLTGYHISSQISSFRAIYVGTSDGKRVQ